MMSLEWIDILSAFGLMLVIEGIMPFVLPAKWRAMMFMAISQTNRSLRVMGLSSMLVGLVVLLLVRG